MKKININHLFIAIMLLMVSITGCNKVLDLEPLKEPSDAAYWKTPAQFQLAANEFYRYMKSFADVIDDNPHADQRGDLVTLRPTDPRNVYSIGANTILTTDNNWRDGYLHIRATNLLLDKAEKYADATTKTQITKYVAEAKFFRAYYYFDLLQQYGGVPIVDKLLAVDSPELHDPRNTRDQVIDFIIKDLEEAIPNLPLESAIATADKGRISKGAAQAFLGRVTLYEGTWQKFRSNATRANALLDKSILTSEAVMQQTTYALFAPAALGDSAQKYMFILEDELSNPAGLKKADNKEYILANRYSYTLRQIRKNISHALWNSSFPLTRKFVHLYLCQDGLPVEKSPLFKGYTTKTSEFANRDNRMRYNMCIDGKTYYNKARTTFTSSDAGIKYTVSGNTGYANQKWCAERKLNDNEEAYDFPVIRLAEVYLNYAEAVFERNGTITDDQLNASLNKVRNRVNKTMPKLSNALVSANGLDMRTEIRRERSIELYFEGFRIDDLKRWKTAETEMPMNIQGITYEPFKTSWTAIKNSIVDGIYLYETNRKWEQKHYLLPIPADQRLLNPNLEQNPGW